MQLAFAGWPVAAPSESLLDIITRRVRSLIDILKQPGRP